MDDVCSVAAGRNLIGGKIDPGKVHYLVLSIRAKVQLPGGKTFGGMLGVRTLATLGAFVDFGSYSLAVPTRFVVEKDEVPNP